MKIGVVGLGVVGEAVQHGLSRIGHEVSGHDSKLAGSSIERVLNTDVCFICVPTNTSDTGVCDTSIVEDVVKQLVEHEYKGIVTTKSTVTPGFTDKLAATYPSLRFAFCPEFLRERAAFTDFFENHDVCAIGAYNDEDYSIIKAAHGLIPKSFAQLTPLEAEFMKYFSNVFNAMRIVFANEFYEVCRAAGADYTKIKDSIVKRDNIPDAYLDCNENFRGFGGACLPKDTRAFSTYIKQLGLDHLKLFETIVTENEKFRTTVFDGMRSH